MKKIETERLTMEIMSVRCLRLRRNTGSQTPNYARHTVKWLRSMRSTPASANGTPHGV